MSQRASILSLLNGQRPADVPTFSGLIHVTTEGVARVDLDWRAMHLDAASMAKAAASTFRATGMPSATLPMDLCAPAEALGAELVFYGAEENMLPQVKKAVAESAKDFTTELTENTEILNRGRIEIICKAISLTKKDIGDEAVISGMLPGPYTLLLYLCNPAKLFIEMKKEPQAVKDALFLLSSFLTQIGNAYREAGADYITVHEMGGSPGFLGPARYEQFVHPAVTQLLKGLADPRVLSVCGDATKSMHLLAESGADAISLDQTVDLAVARSVLGKTLLFGNLDPVATLWQGDRERAWVSARRAKETGVDAVWPGCDLVPQTPIHNLQALIQ